MTTRGTDTETEGAAILATFARMDTVAMSLAMGVACALGLMLATAVLLIAGAMPGTPIGPNLGGLGTFLPGYRVSWPGVLLAAAYGAIGGASAGFVSATFWNFAHLIFLGSAMLRQSRPDASSVP